VLRKLLVGIVSFIVLDGLWLGTLMNGFYRKHLGPMAMTTADGALAPIWAATIPVYVLMALGLAVFVLPRSAIRSPAGAARYGAIFGWILFGVYDFTNYSTLRHYSLVFAMVDTAWGGVSCAVTAVVMQAFGTSRS